MSLRGAVCGLTISCRRAVRRLTRSRLGGHAVFAIVFG
jgi:hypothetical protein